MMKTIAIFHDNRILKWKMVTLLDEPGFDNTQLQETWGLQGAGLAPP